MVEVLKIHLARPGGQKEGPFGLDELNEGLAAEKFQATDYWAWHEGLPQWVPLYEIEGILKVPIVPAAKPADSVQEQAAPTEESTGIVSQNEEKAPTPILLQTQPEQETGFAVTEPNKSEAPLPDPGKAPEQLVSEAGNTPAAEDEPIDSTSPEIEEGGAVPGDAAEAQDAALELSGSEAAAAEPDLHPGGPPLTPEEPRPAPAEATEPAVDLTQPVDGAPAEAQAADPATEALEAAAATEEEPSATEPSATESDSLTARCSSGMPFEALEQIFIFTTGDGLSVWESPRVAKVLQAITGRHLSAIRQHIPRDVMFNCQTKQLLKGDGSISDVAWRAMSIRQPEVVQRAQAKFNRTCVCTFTTELKATVALVLFYRNEPAQTGEPKADSEFSAAAAQPAQVL